MAHATLTFLLVMAATAAAGDDALRFVRVRYVDQGVTVQSGDDWTEPASVNLPYLPGDRLHTGTKGRAELQLADGTLVRLDKRSQLDSIPQSVDPPTPDRLELALRPGSAVIVLAPRPRARLVIETAQGRIEIDERVACRIDAERDGTTVSVLAGDAALVVGGEELRLRTGQAATAARGGRPALLDAFAPPADAFARWSAARGESLRGPAPGETNLPESLWPYAEELEGAGEWFPHADLERSVWRPFVLRGGQPFLDGRWFWTTEGWFWVDGEPWGWVTSHYGRWGHTDEIGWHWIPGEDFSPAWVVWEQEEDYVGWAPWYEELFADIDVWVFTHRRDFRNHDLHRCRIQRPRTAQREPRGASGRGGHAVPRGPSAPGKPPSPAEPERGRVKDRLPQLPPEVDNRVPRLTPPADEGRVKDRLPRPPARPTPRPSPTDAGPIIPRVIERGGPIRQELEQQADEESANRQRRDEEERQVRERFELERREAEARSAREQTERQQRDADQRAQRERADQERADRERRDSEARSVREQAERQQREAQESQVRDRAEQDRREAEARSAREQTERQQRDADQRTQRERADQERADRERRENDDRLAKERAEAEAQQQAKVRDALRQ